jgi:hypothetical protein
MSYRACCWGQSRQRTPGTAVEEAVPPPPPRRREPDRASVPPVATPPPDELHKACKKADLAHIGRLVESRCDVNRVIEEGKLSAAPIHVAATAGSADAVRLLLRSNAQIGTLVARMNYGISLGRTGQYQSAHCELRAAADGLERQLGETHAQTLMAQYNLCLMLEKVGERADALRIMQLVVAGQTRILGTEDRRTRRSIGQLERLSLGE